MLSLTLVGVKLRNSERCKYCTERKRSCIRGNAFRFRSVKAVKFNAGEDIGSAEQSLEFRSGQTWVDIPSSSVLTLPGLVLAQTADFARFVVRFIAPNTDEDDEAHVIEDEVNRELEIASDAAGGDFLIAQPSRGSIVERNDSASDNVLLSYRDRSPFPGITVPTFHSASDLPSIHNVLSNHISPNSTTYNASSADCIVPKDVNSASTSDLLPTTDSWHGSPSIQKKSPLEFNNNIPPYNSSAFSPSPGINLRWPVNNAYEARLFHHYIIYCTDWIDVCDSRRHFEKEVPKRAAHFPVILNGILGLAARHLWLMGKVAEDYSQPYVDQCLQALIVALEDPLAHWDENFLVAVILLRLHEEMGDADDQCHHFGTSCGAQARKILHILL